MTYEKVNRHGVGYYRVGPNVYWAEYVNDKRTGTLIENPTFNEALADLLPLQPKKRKLFTRTHTKDGRIITCQLPCQSNGMIRWED